MNTAAAGMEGKVRIDMESSRTSQSLKRALAAAAASGNGNPLAFAFPARHNLSYASRTVSLIVVDAVVRPGGPLRPPRPHYPDQHRSFRQRPGHRYLSYPPHPSAP